MENGEMGNIVVGHTPFFSALSASLRSLKMRVSSDKSVAFSGSPTGSVKNRENGIIAVVGRVSPAVVVSRGG